MKISIQIKHRKSNWLTYVMYQYEQNSHKIAIIIHATSWGKGGGMECEFAFFFGFIKSRTKWSYALQESHIDLHAV